MPTTRKRREHRLSNSPRAKEARRVLASALLRYRQSNKVTQGRLAAKIGCSPMQIAHLESGHNDPSHALYLGVCDALGTIKPPLT